MCAEELGAESPEVEELAGLANGWRPPFKAVACAHVADVHLTRLQPDVVEAVAGARPLR